MLVQLEEHLASECIIVLMWLFCDGWCHHHPRMQYCSWWHLHHCVHATHPLIRSPISPTYPPLVLSSVTRSTAWRSALSSPLAFQKSQTMFFSRLSFLVIHFQIHFAPNLWPPTVSDSLFATCENVSISMTGWGRLLVGYRSETCHCTSLWWWCQGWGGLLWLHYLRSSGEKSRPCSAVWFCHGYLSLPEYFGVNTVLCTLN